MLAKNFAKLRIPAAVQQCRWHRTRLRYKFLYSVGGNESVSFPDSTCMCLSAQDGVPLALACTIIALTVPFLEQHSTGIDCGVK